jgi:hypothetical protein
MFKGDEDQYLSVQADMLKMPWLRVLRGSLTGMMGMKGCRSICIVSF